MSWKTPLLAWPWLLALLIATQALATAWAQTECAPGIEFYESGTVSRCELTANQRFRVNQAAPWCSAGQEIRFHPTGGLEECVLADSISGPWGECAQGSAVAFDVEGNLLACEQRR